MGIDTQRNGELRKKWFDKIHAQIYARLHFIGIVDDDIVEPTANSATNAVCSSGILLDVIDDVRDEILDSLRGLGDSDDIARAELIILGYSAEQAYAMYPSSSFKKGVIT